MIRSLRRKFILLPLHRPEAKCAAIINLGRSRVGERRARRMLQYVSRCSLPDFLRKMYFPVGGNML